MRYDRSLLQRKHFIHEAELSAPLNHENVLHLYGVVLPGLYADSVALVSYCIYFILLDASRPQWLGIASKNLV